jgi:hypothetical protein
MPNIYEFMSCFWDIKAALLGKFGTSIAVNKNNDYKNNSEMNGNYLYFNLGINFVFIPGKGRI